ncbi:MAG TPA: hypothetical protein VFL47_16990, partial [Flavisolibacter sp.]|nr:hypothetical protein [Flavisolibacter sp.]
MERMAKEEKPPQRDPRINHDLTTGLADGLFSSLSVAGMFPQDGFTPLPNRSSNAFDSLSREVIPYFLSGRKGVADCLLLPTEKGGREI